MRIRWTTILVMLIVGHICAAGQNQHVTEEEYLEIIDESGITDTKKGLRLRKKYYPEPVTDESPELQQPGISFIGAFIMKLIAYFLLVLMIILVIYLVMANVNSDKKLDKELSLYSDEIEDIEDVDAEKGYNDALANLDYRLAIRMRFIQCLQLLASKELIKWEKEKTNRQYYREISGVDIKYSFREIATIFERWWYSEEGFDVNNFRQHDQKFLSFINKLK